MIISCAPAFRPTFLGFINDLYSPGFRCNSLTPFAVLFFMLANYILLASFQKLQSNHSWNTASNQNNNPHYSTFNNISHY